MSNDIREVDPISEIASLTGLKVDVIKLVMEAYGLVVLSKILESQLDDDDSDFIDLGMIVVDNTDHPHVHLRVGLDLTEKVREVVMQGRDFLAESVAIKFNQELLKKYFNEGESLFDHDPAISQGEDK